ncbi:hypothetical protein H4P12_12780 [Paracoccus sp. 11-3]|uniref:DUF3325 domain-containing protein n=1 Tax=Paracoccus amoyensis TaxID=2760093 RepID=A0A926GE91_9RHOB|nr:hypothetical protein [Paracoccus amoyensis]MBC9247560.1 hypothetical protein [Paracoccus amoyensis]
MIPFALAALCLLILIAVHLTVGQKEVVRPLLRSDALPADVKYTLFLCWHVVTLVMVLAALAYIAAAISPSHASYSLPATITMGLLSLWCLAVVLWKRQRQRDMPQWIAFALVAILGAWGHWGI